MTIDWKSLWNKSKIATTTQPPLINSHSLIIIIIHWSRIYELLCTPPHLTLTGNAMMLSFSLHYWATTRKERAKWAQAHYSRRQWSELSELTHSFSLKESQPLGSLKVWKMRLMRMTGRSVVAVGVLLSLFLLMDQVAKCVARKLLLIFLQFSWRVS